jgi:hypothetical protein
LGTKAGTVMRLFSSETVNYTPDELRHNMICTRIRTLVRYDISEGRCGAITGEREKCVGS